jgi:YidC/Oxa1 family membrane protein insertase
MISCSVLFQALQPEVKEIQAKYQSNPEVMNQKISEAYKENNVNPLAGCLPSIVQIPVFIGLYRSVLDLAKENKLDEGFLFLPSLEGPIYGADAAQGSAWLFSGWTDGVPSLGWDDTLAFLVLPVVLVISQFASMELMAPKDQPQQSNAILKLLPLMIGWFSLNVPAALCIYWVTNNIVTTATSLFIRNNMELAPAAAGGATAAPSSPAFAPTTLRQKPAGFGDGVTPITSAIDAEVLDSEHSGDDDSSGGGMSAEAVESNKRGAKKKKKRRKN